MHYLNLFDLLLDVVFFVIFCALKSRRVTHLPSTQESSSERRAPQDGRVETGRTRSNDMS